VTSFAEPVTLPAVSVRLSNTLTVNVLLDTLSRADEVSLILGCGTDSMGGWCPMFRGGVFFFFFLCFFFFVFFFFNRRYNLW
jgi:hypothetical protein